MDREPEIAPGRWAADVEPEVRVLADELVPIFYDDLRRIARRERSRMSRGNTLQTTALVHEAYMKLRREKGWNDDAHFLRSAALAMRHALVNHAEAQHAAKRGGVAPHVSLTDELEAMLPLAAEDETVLALNAALERLALESPRLAQVVECRFFGGYDERATGLALGLLARTVRRDWTLARAWLHRELAGGA